MSELDDRQAEFCRGYVLHFNASRAARDAGYSVRSAGQQAADLLKNPKIIAEIDRLKAEKMAAANFGKGDAIELCLRALTLDIVDVFDNTYELRTIDQIPAEFRVLIEKVTTKTVKGVKTVTVEFMSKMGALNLLSKLNEWQGSEISVNVNITDEDAERRIKELMEELEKGKTNE